MSLPSPDEAWPTADEAAGSRLFSPVRIGPVTASSRTWVPAMVPWRASEEGVCTDDVVAWYERLARGRPGVLVVEATGIRDVPSGPLLRIGSDRFVPGLSRIVDAVRRASAGETRVFVQLVDFLAIRRRPEPQRFFERFFELGDRHRTRLVAVTRDAAWERADASAVTSWLAAASEDVHRAVLDDREFEALSRGARERVTDLHLPHIRALPDVLPGLFAAAAVRAERAGFDGVELHYAHAYTMASFLSRRNDRSDGYGRSAEGRRRLPLEVFRAVRDAVSPRTAVGCRMLADEVIVGGSTLEDTIPHAVAFARAGMDFLSLSRGGKFEDAAQPRVGHAAYPYTGPSGHECMPTVRIGEGGPFGRQLPFARALRRAVREAGFDTPVVAAGGLRGFVRPEQALRDGDADVIAAARQSLADPDWWYKVRTGRGAQVRLCHYTNYCEALDQMHKEVTCRLWDRIRPGDPDQDTATRSRDGARRLLAPEWKP